jgi:ABC-type multidrug transport system permease subunit
MDDAERGTVKPVASPGTAAIGRKSGDKRLHPLWELTLARVREFVREPEALFWVFGFPVLLTCALGIAFRNTAPEKNRIAVVIKSPEQTARVEALARSLSESQDVEAKAMRPEEAFQALRTGKIALVVDAAQLSGSQASSTGARVEHGASTDGQSGAQAAGGSAGVEYRFDPTRPESRIARLAVDDALQRHLGRTDVTEVHEEKVSEPGARYIDFLVPGLIGMNLMGSGMWGLGFAVVQARNRKLLKRLAATPMRRSHFLLSFAFSRLAFLILEVGAVIAFAWLVFSVAVHGSILDVTIVSLIGSMTFAGLGLLVAARPKTIEGVSGLMNLVMLPMWLLSGTFFSASRFPDAVQPIIKALPLTALNDSLRAVMSDGAPLAASWQPLAIMGVWGVVSFALALKLFRWQ